MLVVVVLLTTTGEVVPMVEFDVAVSGEVTVTLLEPRDECMK